MQPTATQTTSGGDSRMRAAAERRFLHTVNSYLTIEERTYLDRVLDYVHQLQVTRATGHAGRAAPTDGVAAQGHVRTRTRWDFGYVISVAQALADTVHMDAKSLAAVLLYQAIELGLASADEVSAALGGEYGAATVELIQSIERFDALQRPAAARRRQMASVGRAMGNRARRRERQHREDAEAMRLMFIGMAEDLRVVIFKIADQLCTMRAVRDAADLLRQRAGAASSHATGVADQPGAELAIEDTPAQVETSAELKPAADVSSQPGEPTQFTPQWTLDECVVIAEETRSLYAPLAGRLGMSRLESELEDLAFAVLEPDEYRWLSETVASEKFARSSYVHRVCDILMHEMA